MQKIKDIWNYSGQYKKYLAALPVMAALEVCCEVLIPYFMSDIIDKGVAEGDMDRLIRTGLFMVAVSVLLGITSFFMGYTCSVWASGVTRNLRQKLFEKIQTLSFQDINRIGNASIITRMSTDMNYIKKALGMVSSLIQCPMMILLTVIMTFKINRSMSWIFAANIPLFAFVLFLIIRFSRRHYRQLFQKYDLMNGILGEDTQNIRTIRAFEKKDYEYDRFHFAASSVMRESYHAEKITALNNPILQLAVNVSVIFLLYAGGINIIHGKMEPGDLFCMITYTNQILAQIMIIALILVPILSAQISLNRVFELLDTVPSQEDIKEEESLLPADGSICFDHVSFGYFDHEPEKYVLKDISLSLPSGSVLGIIGASGSSKSTLVHLLLRFYDPAEGTISVGGHDIRNYSFEALRSVIGFVPQKSILYSGTIRENLSFGNENATEEDMIYACRAVCAHDFIMSFPDGYDTRISEKGTSLSGGQRQRLCIARALIRKPDILILDDSLSALDTVTDQAVRKSLSSYYKGTTIIMIAQRISSIQSADQILVLDNGSVSGMGTHEKLLAENTIYREIDQSQKKNME